MLKMGSAGINFTYVTLIHHLCTCLLYVQ